MKKFLQQPINFAYAVIVMLTLTLGIGVATASYSAPGGSVLPLIHLGGGEQAVSMLKLGPCVGSCDPALGSFDASESSNTVSLFMKHAENTLFYVSNSMYALDKLFIGTGNNSGGTAITASPEIAIWKGPQGPNNLTAPLQQVNVAGNVRATNLNNTGGLPKACVTRTGVITLCPQPSPIIGLCGSAAGGTYSTAPTSGLCDSGTAGTVSPGTDSEGNPIWSWTCHGSNGGADANCAANRQITYQYEWVTEPWGECTGTSGSCSGTPANDVGAKIDWNGMLFNWDDGRLYINDRTTRAACSPWNGQSEFHSVVGRAYDYNAGGGAGQACITDMFPPEGNQSWKGNNSTPSYPGYVYYEANVGAGYWEKITVRGGPVGMQASEILSVQIDYSMPLYETGKMYRSICGTTGQGQYPSDMEMFCDQTSNDPIQRGEWVFMQQNYWCSPNRAGARTNLPDNPRINRTQIGYNNPQYYMDFNNPQHPISGYACIPQNFGTCNGMAQNLCQGTNGCTWTPGQAGTQTREVWCRNVTLGTQVNPVHCINNVGPMPPTSRSCNSKG